MEELKASYTFLRRVEHWVQLDQNRQTQKLPRAKEARARLALALGFGGDEGVFVEHLGICCGLVHDHFLALFGSESADKRSYDREEEEPFGGPAGDADSPEAVPSEALARLRATLSAFSPSLEKTIREILGGYPLPGNPELQDTLPIRLDRYFSQVARRPGLMKVFRSSTAWLGDFCRGIATSELLATLLAHHPGLVEGVATATGICPAFTSWDKAGVRLLQRIEDYGESLEWIRRFRNERLLQLILADLRGDLNSETLETELSKLADFVIRHTYERVCRTLDLDPDLPLAVLALGRLGSREMSYLSDLDLVFVYRPRPGEADDLIPAAVVRLVQRFMRMLSTPLHEGPGYEVDARLRPTGNYGPLIVTRSSWLDYYLHQADLWEVQALLRVRCAAGNVELGAWIEEQAREICYQKRDPAEVWGRLCHLRQRMERERAEEKGDRIDIKLGLGGLTDFEFLAQGYALTDGYRLPQLQVQSVRSALAVVLEQAAPLQDSAREVTAALETLRALAHRLRLHSNLATSRLGPEFFEAMKKLRLWPPHHHGSAIEDWQDLIRLRRRARSALQCFCPDL